ncbi:hypothetical protein LWI29_020146 [Acer saccharum]|uniref:Glycosyl transferase CAP10 domain-containing protein n=1 Tax=Acer saccharum TaxID=4024 RepID=A0AA39T8D2_ACESA|nr:hypothetical protein LWI29_020146 [Acer saccharum]
MGLQQRNHPPPLLRSRPTYLLPSIVSLSIFSLAALLLYKVDDVILRTKTLAGHNLDPTPWHVFPPKVFDEEARRSIAYKAFQCSYLTCPSTFSLAEQRQQQAFFESSNQVKQCPEVFRWIHHDLEPWTKTRITTTHIAESKNFAAFRVVIVGGRLFVDLYYDCVQSRAMFTIWGLLQLLKKYPGMVPDVDMMFDCMDKPILNRTEHGSLPLPLFRYCTTGDHFDIPFPDWSFWGWPETNLRPWNEEFRDIKQGSRAQSWIQKWPLAYWKGNPDVFSPIRQELLNCNHSTRWGAEIMRQNWMEEAKSGYEQSKLSNQCKHRYKIYAEGYAWSVSLKYILSCGSVTLIISPKYEDFFSRGLFPKKNYWPVSSTDLCPSIKFAVDWGNANPSEAMLLGKRGQNFMESLSMDRIYDYMFHLISEYSKLLDFKPSPPSSAQEVCSDSLLCLADPKSKKFLERSTTSASPTPPCKLQNADGNLFRNWMQQKKKAINDVETMKAQKQPAG